MRLSAIITRLAELGIRLPVQTHVDDSATIADADGSEICVIDPNHQRDDSTVFEITALLIELINVASTPIARASLDASDIGAQAVDVANELGAVLQGKNTAACFIALSMVLGASAAMAARPDFDGMMKRIESGARDSFLRAMQEQGRG
ncbi:hypothetical protein [Aminobacter aminovorans]|uniref:Uncharacterized protein n=1 Tax=Aminobacter aminovorans TaxID=83263 RepID=A0AAC8YN82_AMIAI|nr:hypothetical protein [Aminobacter aminovorans]AMS41216.1 hypothetical protein AA2016_2288 [Aminobacter aminovorans]MBB3705801.1 hypothetical protein [Aminobacter aminovorans]